MEKNILIVDDVRINRGILKALLKDTPGVCFFEAENGLQAIKTVESQDIDIILLDLVMPEWDGFYVLRELKARSRFSAIPVIVNSALDDISSIQEALQLGAYDYFTKPLTVEQMRVVFPIKVQNALKSYEQHKMLTRFRAQTEEELRLANLLQLSMVEMPQESSVAGIYGKYLPSAGVGGDFYTCVEQDGRLWFIVADVSGHGVAAAMISSMLKVMFEQELRFSKGPGEILKAINNRFYTFMEDRYYITAFVGLIEAGRLCYANAAHPYPLLAPADSDNELIELTGNSFALAMFSDSEYEEKWRDLRPGDVIIVYTDGCVDNVIMNYAGWDRERAMRFMYRNLPLIKENPRAFIDEKLGFLEEALKMMSYSDDAAVLILKCKDSESLFPNVSI